MDVHGGRPLNEWLGHGNCTWTFRGEVPERAGLARILLKALVAHRRLEKVLTGPGPHMH